MSANLMVNPDLIQKYGDRHTDMRIYPAPECFAATFNHASYPNQLQKGKIGGLSAPLALYLHVKPSPLLSQAHATEKTLGIDSLLSREIELLKDAMAGGNHQIDRIRCAAGSDTLSTLSAPLKRARSVFQFKEGGASSIDFDADFVTEADIKKVVDMGFNHINLRLSPMSAELAGRLTFAIRRAGIENVGIELLITDRKQKISPGLLDCLMACSADQLKLTHQSSISRAETIKHMRNGGYVYLGPDCYARLGGLIATAKKREHLSWDMGHFSQYPPCDTIGLGIGAISHIGAVYAQNEMRAEKYYEILAAGRLPIACGLTASTDDLIRRSVIEALLCRGTVNLRAIGIAYLIHWEQYFVNELFALEQFVLDGLVKCQQEWILLTPTGSLYIEAVCAVFDRYRPRSAS